MPGGTTLPVAAPAPSKNSPALRGKDTASTGKTPRNSDKKNGTNYEAAAPENSIEEQTPNTMPTTMRAAATEAPTTTTTRAPSRLRESDGSLSSSAWVCAPLLLAVSALACTTLG
ncbi:putative mucin TcMUCII [Trypanosoma cruzi]|nr:putative mucin TcMUCII [Trypanosoma cruzi]